MSSGTRYIPVPTSTISQMPIPRQSPSPRLSVALPNIQTVQKSIPLIPTTLTPSPAPSQAVLPTPPIITVPAVPPSPTLGLSSRTPVNRSVLPRTQHNFDTKDYQSIIQNASIENELINSGYKPISKIVVKTDAGQRKTQYIKAVNKKGQKSFVLVDVSGYTTAKPTDLTLIESQNLSIVPYSLKSGAYECAGMDVCGVAFECGTDAVCVVARNNDDLSPKESNFIYIERQPNGIDDEGSITTYPVIRLSEIRSNPEVVLHNTDAVTRRLRNESYQAAVYDLESSQKSIDKLNEAFARFDTVRKDVAGKLSRTLQQLEQWNEIYISNPPTTDELKSRYNLLKSNLTRRNDGITTLLRIMRKVADKRAELDTITREINELTDLAEKEFANVEYVVTD